MNIKKLKNVIPDNIFNQLETIVSKYNINTSERMAHFIGNCMHESGNFKVTEENLNYSSDRLKVIFPKYFKLKDATLYNRKPQAIANLVYSNRMGNGDEKSGDGWKYRGRGYIQLTGKTNYKLFTDFIRENCIDNPDLVASKYALESAAWFWITAKCNKICDSGCDDKTIASVRKIVNGGTIGLDDVVKKVKFIYNLIK